MRMCWLLNSYRWHWKVRVFNLFGGKKGRKGRGRGGGREKVRYRDGERIKGRERKEIAGIDQPRDQRNIQT